MQLVRLRTTARLLLRPPTYSGDDHANAPTLEPSFENLLRSVLLHEDIVMGRRFRLLGLNKGFADSAKGAYGVAPPISFA